MPAYTRYISFLGLLWTDGEPYYDSVWKSAAAPHFSSKDQKPRAFSAGLDTASYFAQTAAAAAAVHKTALAPDTVCAILDAHRHDVFGFTSLARSYGRKPRLYPSPTDSVHVIDCRRAYTSRPAPELKHKDGWGRQRRTLSSFEYSHQLTLPNSKINF
jgi:hypothetical protein